MQRHDRTHSATASHVLLCHTVDIPFFLKRIIWDIFLTVLAIQHQKNVERLNSLHCVPRRSSNKTRGRGRLAIRARARARTLSISRAFIRRAPVRGPEHNTAKLYASPRTRPLNSRPRALALAMYLHIFILRIWARRR